MDPRTWDWVSRCNGRALSDRCKAVSALVLRLGDVVGLVAPNSASWVDPFGGAGDARTDAQVERLHCWGLSLLCLGFICQTFAALVAV